MLRMHFGRLLALSSVFVVATTAVSAESVCTYLDLEHSAGATICECPAISAVFGYATGGPEATITSRRLVCSTSVGNHGWDDTGTLCLDLKGSSAHAGGEYKTYAALFCPKLTGAAPQPVDSDASAALPDLIEYVDALPAAAALAALARMCRSPAPQMRPACLAALGIAATAQ